MSKLSLSNQNWSAFSLSDSEYFTIYSTNSGIDKNKLVFDNPNKVYPYVTRTDKENGYDMFIGKQDKKLNPRNCITIGLDTQTVYYQPKEFYTGQNVQIVESKFINERIAMFLVPQIKSTLELLSWGSNGATLGRLKAKKIMLPTTTLQTGEKVPDWQFMEDYIKELGGGYKIPSLETKRVSGTSDNQEVKLTDREWNNFRVDQVFVVINGVRLTDSDQTLGNRPFIGSTDKNNGITNWVSNSNKSLDKNSIGWNYNGSVGYNFYHPYEAVFSDDVKHLKIKGNNFSPEIAMFVSSQLEMQRSKYQYGYKLNSQRMNAQNIVLPTLLNDPKTPDWKFMETYIKSLPNSQYLTQKIGFSS